MEISEIKANIYREDKMIAAVNCECSERMVNMILSGGRNAETDTAKAVLKELERLAQINIEANAKKNQAA